MHHKLCQLPVSLQQPQKQDLLRSKEYWRFTSLSISQQTLQWHLFMEFKKLLFSSLNLKKKKCWHQFQNKVKQICLQTQILWRLALSYTLNTLIYLNFSAEFFEKRDFVALFPEDLQSCMRRFTTHLFEDIGHFNRNGLAPLSPAYGLACTGHNQPLEEELRGEGQGCFELCHCALSGDDAVGCTLGCGHRCFHYTLSHKSDTGCKAFINNAWITPSTQRNSNDKKWNLMYCCFLYLFYVGFFIV